MTKTVPDCPSRPACTTSCPASSALGPQGVGGDGSGARRSAWPNTYEVPGCQETDYPYERIFSHFFRFVCSESIVTWQHVLTSFP